MSEVNFGKRIDDTAGIEDVTERSESLGKAMDRAAKYLAYKPRTRRELLQHLREKGVDADDAEQCVETMESYHLVDDLEYSRMYIETMLERGRGMDRIRRELAGKGVDRNTIEDALAEIGELPDESEIALRRALDMLYQTDVMSMEYEEQQKVRARIARKLNRQGFRTETVYSAVRKAFELRRQEQEEQEQ